MQACLSRARRVRWVRVFSSLFLPAALSFPPSAQAAEDAASAAPVLERTALIQQVLRANPSLQAAQAAWQAALARPAQAGGWEDPTLSYNLAPLSIGRSDVRFGQEVQLSQGIPFPGKRQLRREIATAEAEASRTEWEATRIRLASMASELFDLLIMAEQELATNEEHLALLRSMKRSAEAQYVAGRATQQDPLQAEVELSQLLQERISIDAQKYRLRAQLNALLHRSPGAPLPALPHDSPRPTLPTQTEDALVEEAIRHRPELAALRARMGGSDAAVRLARREFLPDVMVMAAYTTMFMDRPHQYMAGVSLNLPVFTGRRRAALEEAESERRRLESESLALVDEIRSEVAQAHNRLQEAHQLDTLLRERLLPAANDQLAAARAGFEAGKNTFQTLLDAQRNLRTIRLRAHHSAAALHIRHAELARALGHIPNFVEPEGNAR